VTVLPKVLEKIPVLIYAGDQDLICNYVGLEAMIKELSWNGATGLGVRSCKSQLDKFVNIGL
jgi:carboxypeptidase D